MSFVSLTIEAYVRYPQFTSVLVLATITLGGSVGCSQPTASNNSAPPSTGAVSSDGGMGNVELGDAGLGDAGLVTASGTPSNSSSLTKSAESEPAKPVAPPQAPPKPTDQQIAKWKQVEFVPLDLVGFREHEKIGYVNFVDLVHGGQEYLLGGTRLTLWSLKDSSLIHEFIEAKTQEKERLLSFAVSPDGTWCVAGDAGGLLRKFDIPQRKEIGTKQLGTKAIVRLAISPDGKEIATLPFNSEVSIWDADTLEKKTSFKVDARDIKHLQYIKAGCLIASGESMSTWDTATGQKLKTYPSQKYQSAIAISADNRQLVFGAKDSLQRWSLDEDKAIGEYRGVPFRDAAVRFTDDGSLVAVAGGDGVRILDANSGQMLQVIDAAGSGVTDIRWIPQSHLLLVGTELARNRIWGRADECRKFGVEPLPNFKIDARGSSDEPANVARNLAVLDLRILPKLPDSKSQYDSFSSVNYTSPSDLSEVKLFYRYTLNQRGWTELPDQATDSSLLFTTHGHNLHLSLYSAQPGQTSIGLTHAGNYDLTKAPRVKVKETTYSGLTTVVYRTEATLLQVEIELLREFYKAGWTSFARLNRSLNESADRRDLEFLKGGTVLRVMIQRDPKDDKLSIVNYTQSLSLHALPVPPDAGLMEWDDALECQMVANTNLSLEQAIAFYEDQMTKQGWIARDKGRRIEGNLAYLPYYWGQRDVTVALEKMSDGSVRVLAGKYSETSWQKPKASGKSLDADKATSDEENQDTKAIGIEAADFPILHASATVSYDSTRGEIRFELDKSPLPDVAKEYETAMEKLGWKTVPFGEPTSESVNLIFKRDTATIYYHTSIDPVGKSRLTVEGPGLLWNKAIDVQQQISYKAWLRNRKLPASLRSLDEYESQMQKLTK